MIIKSRAALLQDYAHAVSVLDLIERLGFHAELDTKYPTPKPGHRLQIRNEKNLAPKAEVTKIAECMRRKEERFPPIVVTKDGYTVDGNTRVEAAIRNGFPFMEAFILDVPLDGSKEHVIQRLKVLGAGFNIRNGKGIDREEIRRAVDEIASNDQFDAKRIAGLLGTTEYIVNSYIAERKAKERAELVGLKLNGSVSASSLRKLGQVSDSLNDFPFQALTALTQDAGLQVGEIGAIVRTMKAARSDQGAIDVVAREREARQDQISLYKAAGKSRPPVSGLLRRSLGFVLNHQPEDMVESNPGLVEEHVEKVTQARDLLNAVLTQQTLR